MALLELFYADDKDTMILQNVDNCLTADTAYHARPESSTPALHPKEFHLIKVYTIIPFIQGPYFM
jgi:hypothetical protein